MTFTYEPSEAAKHVTHLSEFSADMESQVSSKVSESPNIMVYGLMCMGVVGWWMQLGQMDAQRLVKSTASAIDYVHEGMQDVIKVYQLNEDGHAEAAERISKISEQIT